MGRQLPAASRDSGSMLSTPMHARTIDRVVRAAFGYYTEELTGSLDGSVYGESERFAWGLGGLDGRFGIDREEEDGGLTRRKTEVLRDEHGRKGFVRTWPAEGILDHFFIL